MSCERITTARFEAPDIPSFSSFTERMEEYCGKGGSGIGFGFGPHLPPFRFSFADCSLPLAKKAIFHGPATIVIWADGTKTVVKCSEDDTFSKETGIALCFMKKALGNNGRYNNTLRRLLKESDHG